MAPHERGAILVAAVFDAFLSIYERRTADLIRLATGGSGLLQPGAIHPDLVARLAEEAARSAQHVLQMCIRALDYCPPVDITFGEFLRAIITADTDAVADDDLRYRVAFVEAFRKWGIYPRDLRTLSEDSLMWRTPDNDETRPSQALQEGLERVRDYAQKFLFAQGDEPESRERTFELQYDLRRSLHGWLARPLQPPPGREERRASSWDWITGSRSKCTPPGSCCGPARTATSIRSSWSASCRNAAFPSIPNGQRPG